MIQFLEIITDLQMYFSKDKTTTKKTALKVYFPENKRNFYWQLSVW